MTPEVEAALRRIGVVVRPRKVDVPVKPVAIPGMERALRQVRGCE